MVRTGEMQKRISIESKSPETRDAHGGFIETWAEVTDGERWAKITPISGKERNQGDQVKALRSHVISMRFFTGMVSSYRIVYDSRIFNIVKVIDVGERGCDTVLDVLEAEVI